MALVPPPSHIFSPSLRTCDIRSARKRMLASKRAEVGSILVVSTFAGAEEFAVGVSLRSAMGREIWVEMKIGLTTVYHAGRAAQCSLNRDAVFRRFSAGACRCGVRLRLLDRRQSHPPVPSAGPALPRPSRQLQTFPERVLCPQAAATAGCLPSP